MIYEFVPFNPNGIGFAYNECCAIVPQTEDWIAFRDSDVMLFGQYGNMMRRAVEEYGNQFDVFTCWATRIGNPDQQYQSTISSERNLVSLKWHTDQASKTPFAVKPIGPHISAHWFMFKKSLWEKFPFPTRTEVGPMLSIDWDWSRNISKHGHRIGLIEPMLAVHYYRMHKHWQDVSHLQHVR